MSRRTPNPAPAPRRRRRGQPAAAAPRQRRAGAIALLVVVVLALAGAVAAEVLVEPPATPAAEPVAVDPPTSGAWYCPVTGSAEDTAVLTVAAVGAEPATLSVERHRGDESSIETATVAPDQPYELVLSDGQAAFATTIRWSGGPVVATWRLEGTHHAGAPCEVAPVPVTHLTGFETTAQSTSQLHLYNPFGVDAVARVVFGTPTGPVARVLTDNILVPARGTTVLTLNEFEPEQPDLAVTVETLTGRLVTQGTVALAPTANQPGPTGRDVITGTQPALGWAFAFARSDEGSGSWLSLYNPNDREAAVEVRVSNPMPDSPLLLSEVSVPAGGVVRVDISGASASTEHGVSATSVNELPVVASRLTSIRASAGSEDVAASTGVVPAQRWVTLAPLRTHRGRLFLYNPGAEPVTVSVDAGESTPPEWAELQLQPNEQTALELEELGEDYLPVVVDSEDPVAVDLRLQASGGDLRYFTLGAVATRAWEGPGIRPAVRRDARLSTRPAELGTADPAAAATAAPTATASEEPTVTTTEEPTADDGAGQ